MNNSFLLEEKSMIAELCESQPRILPVYFLHHPLCQLLVHFHQLKAGVEVLTVYENKSVFRTYILGGDDTRSGYVRYIEAI